LTAAALSAGYGVMFAVLAKMRDTYGLSETMLGAIVGIGFFASFAAQITLAPLADRGFARHLLLGGLVCNASGLVLVAVSSSAPGFLLGRTLMGLGIGGAYPALRRSIAFADPDNVGRNLGGMMSYDVAGFLVGPVMAGLLAGTIGIRWPFVIAAAISASFLPITWRTAFGPAEAGADDQPRFAIGLLRYHWLQAAAAYGVAFFIMIGLFDALWAVRIDDLHGATYYVTLGIVIFAAPLVVLGERGGQFVEARGPYRVGAIGLCVGATCLALYGLLPVPWLMIGVGMVHATNDAFTAASVPIAVSLAAPSSQIAGAQGLVGALQTLTGGFAALGAGAVYDHFGPVATYTGGSTAMLVCIAFGWWRSGELRDLRRVASTFEAPTPANPVPVPF
jgi:MFS family permease